MYTVWEYTWSNKGLAPSELPSCTRVFFLRKLSIYESRLTVALNGKFAVRRTSLKTLHPEPLIRLGKKKHFFALKIIFLKFSSRWYNIEKLLKKNIHIYIFCFSLPPVGSGRSHRRLGHQGGTGGDQGRQVALAAPEGHGRWGGGQPRGQSQGTAPVAGTPPPPPQLIHCSCFGFTPPSFSPPKQVIAAEGEMNASRALKEASLVIAESPSALQLRYLQTLNTIAAEKNSTIIFPLPLDMLQGLMKRWAGGVQGGGGPSQVYTRVPSMSRWISNA